MKKLFMLILLVPAVAGGYYYVVKNEEVRTTDETITEPSQTAIEDSTPVEPEPEETKNEVTQNEEPDEQGDDPESPQAQKNVSVTLTYAEDRGTEIVVSSFANASKAGTCKLTLAGPKNYTEQKSAEFNVNKYDCIFTIRQSKITSGMYTASVVFSSNTEQGTSNKFEFEVQ